MIDRGVMLLMLTVLREQADLSCGTEENALFNEINLRSPRATTSGLIMEHLVLAEDKGWIDRRVDSLFARRWRITPAGRGELNDLKLGG